MLGTGVKRLLPDGLELNVPENGVEAQLIRWLNGKSKKVHKAIWFNFDRLVFERCSAKLDMLSNQHLGNIAASSDTEEGRDNLVRSGSG